MRQQGRIVQWQDTRGFGFIQPARGGERVFVHVSEIDGQRPSGGEPVSYELRRDDKGRRQAIRVRIEGHHQPRPAATRFHIPLITGAAFMTLVAALSIAGALPVIVPLTYATLSILTYLVYGWDKWSAQRRSWRTPERTLLLLGLAGGWPGALLAQRTLRHKSSKQSFQVQFWITVLVNCAGLVWLLLDPQASSRLQDLFLQG